MTINIPAQIFIYIGLFFIFLGCLGFVRFPDLYNRLQGATKCVTLGACSILLGVIINSGLNSFSGKAFMAMIFIILTSPTSAHALAKGSYAANVKLWYRSVCDKYKEKFEGKGIK